MEVKEKMILRIAHVGIATRSIEAAAAFYRTLGLEIHSQEAVSEQKVKIAMLRLGDSSIELLEASELDSPVSRFIERRGEGIHHISIEVDNLAELLETLREANVQLIDETPRTGADGQLTAFVHPRSAGGVLVELCQPVSEIKRTDPSP